MFPPPRGVPGVPPDGRNLEEEKMRKKLTDKKKLAIINTMAEKLLKQLEETGDALSLSMLAGITELINGELDNDMYWIALNVWAK